MDKECFKNFSYFLDDAIKNKANEYIFRCNGMGRCSVSKPWQCFTLELYCENIKEKYFIECDVERMTEWKYWAFDPSYHMMSNYKGAFGSPLPGVGEDKEGLKFFAHFALEECHGKSYQELLEKHPELAKQCRLEREWPILRITLEPGNITFIREDTVTWDVWDKCRFNPKNVATNHFSSIVFEPTAEDYAIYKGPIG